MSLWISERYGSEQIVVLSFSEPVGECKPGVTSVLPPILVDGFLADTSVTCVPLSPNFHCDPELPARDGHPTPTETVYLIHRNNFGSIRASPLIMLQGPLTLSCVSHHAPLSHAQQMSQPPALGPNVSKFTGALHQLSVEISTPKQITSG